MARNFESSLQPQEHSTASTRRSTQRETSLGAPQRQWTLQLEVDGMQRVTALHSSCGLAQQNQALLLNQQGYEHLFWCMLQYLNEYAATGRHDVRDTPLTTLDVHPSITMGTSGCLKAAAARILGLDTFTSDPTRAFVRVDAGGQSWIGQPMLLATLHTPTRTKYQVIYCKWLDFELTGIERLKQPLPATFPIHQWAQAYMGLAPRGGHEHKKSDMFGLVDASKVTNWEPIVSIGVLVWRPTSAYLCEPDASDDSTTGRKLKRKRKKRKQEKPPQGLRVGEPLFANNVHTWSFGS